MKTIKAEKKIPLTLKHRLQFLWIALNPMNKAVLFSPLKNETIFFK